MKTENTQVVMLPLLVIKEEDSIQHCKLSSINKAWNPDNGNVKHFFLLLHPTSSTGVSLTTCDLGSKEEARPAVDASKREENALILFETSKTIIVQPIK